MGSTPSKGMGGDMFAKKISDGVDGRMVEGSKTRNSTAFWAMELQLLSENVDESLCYELMGTEEKRSAMNESAPDTVVLDLREFDTTPTKKCISFFRAVVDKETEFKKSGDMLPPRVHPGTMDDKEVKRIFFLVK